MDFKTGSKVEPSSTAYMVCFNTAENFFIPYQVNLIYFVGEC